MLRASPASRAFLAVVVALCVLVLGAGTYEIAAASEAPPRGRVTKAKAVTALSSLVKETRRARPVLGAKVTGRLSRAASHALRQARRGETCRTARQLGRYVGIARRPTGARRSTAAALGRRAKRAQLLVLRVPRRRGACGPKPRVQIRQSLQPSRRTVPGRGGANPRPVARIAVKGSPPADFVADEVLVAGRSGRGLERFLKRWNGKVLATTTPPGGKGSAVVRLVRIDPKRVKTGDVPADLLAIDPRARGTVQVSDRAGLESVAAAADGAAGGMQVGLNWLAMPDDLLDGSLADTVPLDAVTKKPLAGANPAQWTYMKDGPPHDIDVAGAWRMLAAADRLQNKVPMAVIDGGFWAGSDDYPQGTVADNVENEVGCGENNPCPWHGTNVSHAAAAVPGNGNGAAGPAGPVATMRHLTYNDGANGVFEAVEVVYDAAGSGARIINMSWHIALPATLSFSLVPFEVATAWARNAGHLLFAAAGNATEDKPTGEDIDAEDCFLACWEETWWAPCENSGVLCVGGLNPNAPGRASGSNYSIESCGQGPCSIDTWAPFRVYVGGDPIKGYAHEVGGTSFSSPFAAGVAALVWAANPALNASGVEAILRNTANSSPDPDVKWYLNARAAVAKALGPVPAKLEISSPTDGLQVQYGPTSLVTLAARAAHALDKSCCAVTWTSSLDGSLGTHRQPVLLALTTPGKRTFTASIASPAGPRTASVTVEGLNTPPTIEIVDPAVDAPLYRGLPYSARSRTADVNEPEGKLACDKLTWKVLRLVSGGMPVHESSASGCDATLQFAQTSAYRLELTGTDGAGATATATREFAVVQAPANAPPIAKIESPKDGVVLNPHQFVQLVGSAIEPDGKDPVSYVWTHTRSGAGVAEVIGTGASISWRPSDSGYGRCGGVSSGTLRLTASDKDGSGSDTISFSTLGQLC